MIFDSVKLTDRVNTFILIILRKLLCELPYESSYFDRKTV